MKVGDLVCTIEDWDKLGLIVKIYIHHRYQPEAKIMWLSGFTEIWCVKDLMIVSTGQNLSSTS